MPSASETAPIWIFSQSSSVFGTVSTAPFLVTTVRTASKMLSATGSIMYRISSLTETMGLMSPQSAGPRGGDWVGFDDEHVDVKTPKTNSPAQMTRGLRVKTTNFHLQDTINFAGT